MNLDPTLITLDLISVICVYSAFEAWNDRRGLERSIARHGGSTSLDDSGLLDRDSFVFNFQAELNRAERFGNSLEVSLLTLLSGSTRHFAELLAEQAEFPMLAFRLADNAFALVNPLSGERNESRTARVISQCSAVGPVRAATRVAPDDGDSAAELFDACAQEVAGA